MKSIFRPVRLLGSVSLLFCLGLGGFYLQGNAGKTPPKTAAPPDDSLVTVHLSFVGDLMCHEHQFKYAQLGPDSFDFNPCFEQVKPWLEKADLMMGNLETTLTGSAVGYSGYPTFNSPDAYLKAIQAAGFDFLVTSNNHSMDKGEAGVLRTLSKLDEMGMPHTGTFASQADRDSVRVIEVKGMRLAVLNYTYGTNGIPLPAGKPWTVNLIDTALIRRDIAAARKTTAELVLVFYHFGDEYQRLPGAYQKAMVNHAIKCGADLIIGAHPHVIQPVDYFKTNGGRLDTGFVAYSLGNFISNQYDRYKDAGLILNLELTRNKNTGSIRISDASYVSTWVYRGTHPMRKIHIIYPTGANAPATLPEWITPDLALKMREAGTDTRSHLQTLTKRIREVQPQ